MSLSKYGKTVGKVTPRASAREACREMAQRQIGCVVVVSDDEKPIGIVTDRDVALRVVAEGRDPERTPVEDIMSTGLTTLPVDASFESATRLMRDRQVRRIPLVGADGRVEGLVSLDDFVLLLGMELGNLASAVFGELAREEAAQRSGQEPSRR